MSNEKVNIPEKAKINWNLLLEIRVKDLLMMIKIILTYGSRSIIRI